MNTLITFETFYGLDLYEPELSQVMEMYAVKSYMFFFCVFILNEFDSICMNEYMLGMN